MDPFALGAFAYVEMVGLFRPLLFSPRALPLFSLCLLQELLL